MPFRGQMPVRGEGKQVAANPLYRNKFSADWYYEQRNVVL